MVDRIENFTPRNPGCEVLLEDRGSEQKVPVCMGGVSIKGCNRAGECGALFEARLTTEDQRLKVHFAEQDNKVTSVTVVRP